eukprot:CAMPEP_0184680826 /NCGR_PEP_ID=MMETSP0312-20130426/3744_1 /TAXON_ID=31354 /ORGANISM="Compsopogon coeruleus, Strain SAG 36.94" /LENGTH=243 /DNA_ID=CAMNT_0027131211 /DNA_START=107 /DNA_END=835 /DNA_ORIENTATION=-
MWRRTGLAVSGWLWVSFAWYSLLEAATLQFDLCVYSESTCSVVSTLTSQCLTGSQSGFCVNSLTIPSIQGIQVVCGGEVDGPHMVGFYMDGACSAPALSNVTVNNSKCSQIMPAPGRYFMIDCRQKPACFSSEAWVLTSSGRRRRLGDIQVGDRVQSIGDDGKPVFSEVFLVQHINEARAVSMMSLELAGMDTPLVVTPDHYLRIPGDGCESYTAASSVQPGDHVYTIREGKMELVLVEEISW